jgi:hypothetical protein
MADLRLTIDASDIPKAQAAVGGLERKITDLARRYAQGSISQQTYNRGLLQLKRNYEQVGISSQRATSEIRRYAAAQLQAARTAQQAATAQRQLATATQGTARGMNRSGVLMQQTGYQVGDFIVQVQSGTNWMVAFGQQATQVAGTLTLLGGKWILLGSVLGVTIPLLTALGAVWMRTRQESEDAGTGVESFADQLKNARRDIAETALELERLNRGFETTAELTLDQAVRNAEQEVARAEAALEGAMRREGSGGPGLTVGQTSGGVEAAQQALELARRQLETYRSQREQVDNINRAEELRAQLAERAVALENARREALLDAGQEAQRQYDIRQEMAQTLQQETQLYQAIAQYGEQSAQVEALRAQQAREAYEARVRETTANEVIISQMMQIYDSTVSAREEADRFAESLGRIANLDTSGTVSAIVAITNALGVATAEAIRLAQSLPGYTSGGVSGPDGAQAQGVGFSTVNGLDPTTIVSSQTFDSGSSGGGGGGGGGVGGFTSIFPELAAQVQAAEQALSSFNQEADILNTALENGMISQQQFNQMLQQAQEAYGVADQAAAQYSSTVDSLSETLASGIGNAFGDFFNSIIDGTKSAEDAFKDMVKAILKQLVQLFIIRPIMNSIQSALGGGGGVFGAGGLFGGFGGFMASGGSVSPGTAYMVGEKGRELFVPNQSGKIINADQTAKMGSQSSAPIINMTYNFQGGITEQDLARALPRMVEETKRSVIDTVQRGGSVARVFK